MSATLTGLAAGENVITVNVSDSGGTTIRSYTVTVTRTVTAEKAPLGLDDLQLSEGSPKPGFMFSAMAGKLPEGDVTVAPSFAPRVTSYTANVSQPLVTVRARAASGVEMRVTGTAAGGDELTASNQSRVSNANGIGGFLSVTLSGLAAGENLVSVEVTDPDGVETKRYRVVLTRDTRSIGETLQGEKAKSPRPARKESQQSREKAQEARAKAREAFKKAWEFAGRSGRLVGKSGRPARGTVRVTGRVMICSRRSRTRTLTESGEPLKRVRMSTKSFPARQRYRRFFSR